MAPGGRNSGPGPDVVPRRMLELCKTTLLRALARNIDLRDQITELEHEVQQLKRILRGRS